MVKIGHFKLKICFNTLAWALCGTNNSILKYHIQILNKDLSMITYKNGTPK